MASGMAPGLVNPFSGSQGRLVAWPTAFLCLTYRAKPMADSCWRPNVHTARHHPLLPTFRLTGLSPLPSLQIGLLQGDACWLSLLHVPDHSESHPMGLLVPELLYICLQIYKNTGAESPPQGLWLPIPPCSSSVGALLSPVTDRKTLSRRDFSPESCYQKTLKELLPFQEGPADIVLCPLARPRFVQLPQRSCPSYQSLDLI